VPLVPSEPLRRRPSSQISPAASSGAMTALTFAEQAPMRNVHLRVQRAAYLASISRFGDGRVAEVFPGNAAGSHSDSARRIARLLARSSIRCPRQIRRRASAR
jgi:hypothetical protein